MRPVTCIALVPDPYGIGEVVVRAYECLHLAGIAPIGYATVDEPLIVLKPSNPKRALAALFAAGFDFREVGRSSPSHRFAVRGHPRCQRFPAKIHPLARFSGSRNFSGSPVALRRSIAPRTSRSRRSALLSSAARCSDPIISIVAMSQIGDWYTTSLRH
jgi:hypothetical protein